MQPLLFRRRFMPVVTCPSCQKDFHAPRSRTSQGRGRFCSRACQGAARSTLPHKVCLFCAKPIVKGRSSSVYCSRRCSARAMYTSAPREKTCLWCGIPFTTLSLHDAFCSRLCEAKQKIALGQNWVMPDPWKEGFILPDCSDREYWRRPDEVLGF